MDNNREQNGIDSVPDYVKRYLLRKTYRGGRCAYICNRHHEMITRLTHFAGHNATISGFIYQVLEEHFNEHKGEINEVERQLLSQGIFQ